MLSGKNHGLHRYSSVWLNGTVIETVISLLLIICLEYGSSLPTPFLHSRRGVQSPLKPMRHFALILTPFNSYEQVGFSSMKNKINCCYFIVKYYMYFKHNLFNSDSD